MRPIFLLFAALLCAALATVVAPTRVQVPVPLPTTFVKPLRANFDVDSWISYKDDLYFLPPLRAT
jgi:hypothetical protein